MALAREHFIQAADYISKNPIPPKRDSRVYVSTIDGKSCPPKWALSVARYMAGDTNEICSGQGFISTEAVRILRDFGFETARLR